MRKMLATAVLVSGMFFLSGTGVSACGDKAIALGRGVRFQRAFAALKPGSILIYAGGNSNGAPVRRSELQSTLKLAGHKVQTVEDLVKLDQALASAKYDLILADVADAAAVARQIESKPSKPVLLPLIHKPTNIELAAAERQYSLLLKTPSKIGDFLATIDQAIKLRAGSTKIS